MDPYYSKNLCGSAKIKIPKAHITNGVNADIIFYISATDDPNEDFLAYASVCN